MCVLVCVLHKTQLNSVYICQSFRGRERRLGAGGLLARICLSAPTFTARRMNAERRISITLMWFDSSLALWGNSVRRKALVSHCSLLFLQMAQNAACHFALQIYFKKSSFSLVVLVREFAVLLNSAVKRFVLALSPLLLHPFSKISTLA